MNFSMILMSSHTVMSGRHG